MKRQKIMIWAGIVAVGLPVGFFGRGLFQQPVNRVQTAMNLFEEYCVSFASLRVIDPGKNLVRLERADGLAWVEPDTTLLLRYSNSTCSVSDALKPMTHEERKAYDAAVAGLIGKTLPDLTPYDTSKGQDWTGADAWPAFLFWESHPVGDERRWGVSYVRFASDAESQTELSVSYRIDDQISENLQELLNGS
ncbi:hypothetical protein [Ruegeria arenilitoris]|uniref:hypothetical protein n=1 Tax=Ruegeria arenilitoris TaxID=1173585 RepID=UPI00147E4E20|nr:hypothetical protein [Ruegeria arenilitoris]